jgi:hypothetical protein
MAGEYDDLRSIDVPRDLHAHERAVIEQLLRSPFDGREVIRTQLEAARVVAEGGGDSRTIRFASPHIDVPRAHLALRVPVEGEAADDDGVPIAVLLHVVDGLVAELEIYRVDGQPIRRSELGALQSVSVNTAR